MKQEIGGYLELEVFHGKEYYPDLVKVNLGRTASAGCWNPGRLKRSIFRFSFVTP